MYTCPYTRKEYRHGPPAGWVMKDGQYSIGIDDWYALVARGVHFEPYDGPRMITKSYGCCLSPLFLGHTHLWELRPLEPDELLIDGGLYVLEPEDQEGTRNYIKKMLGLEKTGRVSITKFLKFVGTEWFLLFNEGVDELGMGTVTHKVVGSIPLTGPWAGTSSTTRTDGSYVHFANPAIAAGERTIAAIRRRALASAATSAALAATSAALLLTGCGDDAAHAPHCNRQPFAADSPECFQIGLNAATTLAQVSVSNVSVPNNTVSTIASLTVGPYPIDTSVIITATGAWSVPGTASAVALVYGISTSATTIPFGSTYQASPLTPNQVGALAAEGTFALPAHTTQTYFLNGNAGPLTGTFSWTALQLTMKAESIKR